MRVMTMVALLMLGSVAWAGGNGPDCDHPNFYVKGCDYPELNGENGNDGPEGPVGPQGPVGPAGPKGDKGERGNDGVDGRDGRDGRDGTVPTDWIEGVGLRFNKYNRYLAATAALEIDQPTRDGASRGSLHMAHLNGNTGVGIGYAWRDDEGTTLKFGLGWAGSGSTVIKGGVSWEF